MKLSRKVLILALAGVFVCSNLLLSAPGLKIERSVVGTGGMLEAKNSTGLTISGLVGQFAIDRIAKNSQVLYQGFWVPTESYTPVDPDPITLSNVVTNYPNPASISTTFKYRLSEPSYVSLKVYDMVGNLIKIVVDEFQSAGEQSVAWDLKNDYGIELPNGNYFYELTINTAQLAGGDSRSTSLKNILVIVK